ncbi:MAG: hypothetical protein ACYTF1_21790 [Planctomycetota bacterium]|jgi:hypothetical protein
MNNNIFILLSVVWLVSSLFGCSLTVPIRTTLSDPAVAYTVPEKHYVVLKRPDVEAVVVDNSTVNDQVLPNHKAGYNGIGSLKHTKRQKNIFVPMYAGLNFEHIHDGTEKARDIFFEPRRWPMELRVINQYTAELYQPPTPNWKLESATRYELLPDGTIQMTFECIPRAQTFKNGYVGLFWASYIHKPESLDVHFMGHDDRDPQPRWVRGVTPSHGKLSTHRPADDEREFPHHPFYDKNLVFSFSNYRYDQPWYFGISHGMALAYIFRPNDLIRFSQSPSGAGKGNPAWDFQFLIPDYKVGQRYGFVMRAAYLPYESHQRIIKATAPNRKALNP